MRITCKIIWGLLLLVIFTDPALAATKAWLIGPEKSLKLNIQSSMVEEEKDMVFRVRKAFSDGKGNLFVLYSSARFVGSIAVMDTKTLKIKGDLNFDYDLLTESDLQMVFPASGNLFYLRMVKKEDGPPEIVVYDATTLKSVKSYTTTPATSNQLLVSDIGDVLYSLKHDGTTIKMDAFKTSDFSYTSSIDIKKFFTLGTEGGIADYGKGKLLVNEVIARTPQLEFFEYIYDMRTDKILPKIKTTIVGDDVMLPQTSKIIFSENRYVGESKSIIFPGDYLFTGKVSIFDATTGQQAGTVQVPVGTTNRVGDIIAVSPAEDRLYMRTYNAKGAEDTKLYVIDLTNNTVVKEIALPDSSISIVFFEE